MLAGPGASSEMLGLYFADGRPALRPPVDPGPRGRRTARATCCTRARCKGRSRAIYSGQGHHPAGRPPVRRVPDEPQRPALGARQGRLHPQPGDPVERPRPVRPRRQRRPGRRGGAVLPAEPGDPVRGGRAARSCPASSRRCWTGSPSPRSAGLERAIADEIHGPELRRILARVGVAERRCCRGGKRRTSPRARPGGSWWTASRSPSRTWATAVPGGRRHLLARRGLALRGRGGRRTTRRSSAPSTARRSTWRPGRPGRCRPPLPVAHYPGEGRGRHDPDRTGGPMTVTTTGTTGGPTADPWPTLRSEACTPTVEGKEILKGIDLTVPPGRGARPHGPERLRQVHAGQRADGPARLQGDGGRGPVQGPGHHRADAGPAGPARPVPRRSSTPPRSPACPW